MVEPDTVKSEVSLNSKPSISTENLPVGAKLQVTVLTSVEVKTSKMLAVGLPVRSA